MCVLVNRREFEATLLNLHLRGVHFEFFTPSRRAPDGAAAKEKRTNISNFKKVEAMSFGQCIVFIAAWTDAKSGDGMSQSPVVTSPPGHYNWTTTVAFQSFPRRRPLVRLAANPSAWREEHGLGFLLVPRLFGIP